MFVEILKTRFQETSDLKTEIRKQYIDFFAF